MGVYEDIHILAKEKDMNLQRIKAVIRGQGNTTKNYFLFDEAIYPTEMARLQRIHEIRQGRIRRVTASDEKPIIAYDMDGNRVAEYQTVKEAISDLKLNPMLLKNVLRGDANSTKGLLFVYEDTDLTKEEQDLLIRDRIHKKRNSPIGKAVNQYTLEGEYIATFKNMSVAGRELGIVPSSIAACTHGRLKQAGGFIFILADQPQDKLKKNLEERVDKIKNKIAMNQLSSMETKRKQLVNIYHYDSAGEFVGYYNDARHAFHVLGIANSTLRLAVSGQTLVTGIGIFLLGADFPSEEARRVEVSERLLEYGQLSSRKGRPKSRPVDLYDTEGNIITTYPSVGQAARENNLSRQQVRCVLEGDYPNIDGKVFIYAESH